MLRLYTIVEVVVEVEVAVYGMSKSKQPTQPGLNNEQFHSGRP